MAAYASVDELSDWLGETVSGSRPTLLLETATDAVKAIIGHDITEGTETATLDGTGTEALVLPKHPVTAISQVDVDGTTLAADAYKFIEAGVVYRTSGIWAVGRQNIDVTYTHGFATIPGDVKAIVLETASRAWRSGAGVSQESVGSYSVTYSRESAGVQLLPQERAALASYGDMVS